MMEFFGYSVLHFTLESHDTQNLWFFVWHNQILWQSITFLLNLFIVYPLSLVMAPLTSKEMPEKMVIWWFKQYKIAAEIARLASCSESTVYDVLRLHQEDGQVTNPYACLRGCPCILQMADMEYIHSLLLENPASLISLLRLWTYNQPYFDFPHDLSTMPCNLSTMPHHLTVTPCDMIQTSGTACTLFQHPENLWHVPRPVICSITLLKDSSRNLDQPQCHTLLYIVSRGSTLECRVSYTPSCLKFYLSYKLFPLFNSCFTILFNYIGLLLCFLSATNQLRSHFYLALFYYKTLCT